MMVITLALGWGCSVYLLARAISPGLSLVVLALMLTDSDLLAPTAHCRLA